MTKKELLNITTAQNDPRTVEINALIKGAATLGREAKEEAEAQAKVAKGLTEKVESARAALGEETDKATGFDTPMFVALAKVGGQWGRIFNDPDSPLAQNAAKRAAESFAASNTGATDATKVGGGTLDGYVNTITLGNRATTARERLAAVVNRHRETIKSLKNDPSDTAKAAVIEARRYTVPCGDAPMADGSWPMDKKTGKPRMPKFNGRTAKTVKVEVNGEVKSVKIEAGRGTDRKAQMAAYAALVHTYGDAALDTSVIEAFLDNGGRYKMPEEVSARGLAAQTANLLSQLNLNGGNTSADALLIGMCLDMLNRVAEKGFEDSKGAADAKEVAVEKKTTQESKAQADAVLPQGAGVVLGAPTVPGSGGRPARAARKPAAARRAGSLA